MTRHPFDVVLSAFSNHFTHGFYCGYDLESIARHYALILDLVEHYRREMPELNYRRVRYEDVIDKQEETVREMLAFVGAPFDRRCLDFHENRRYARTASYAQVTEKLYDRSRFRFPGVSRTTCAYRADSGAGAAQPGLYARLRRGGLLPSIRIYGAARLAGGEGSRTLLFG